MSKTAILFTTYYIEPNTEAGLFKKDAVENPKIFTGQRIRKFFWNRLDKDISYLENHLLDCIKNPNSIKKESDSQNKKIDELLEKYHINKENRKWKSQLQTEITNARDFELLAEIVVILENYSDKAGVSLEGKDFEWLATEILTEGKQVPFDIYISQPTPGPWLYRRLCYYELNSVDRPGTSIYAVWALDTKEQTKEDKSNEWIEALTEQIIDLNDDVEEIILVLHNKDIGDSAFQVVEPSKKINYNGKEISRTVAVFAHVGDEIGRMLDDGSNYTAQGVYNLLATKCYSFRNYLLLIEKLANGDTISKNDLDSIRDKHSDMYKVLGEMVDKLNNNKDCLRDSEIRYELICKANDMIQNLDDSCKK